MVHTKGDHGGALRMTLAATYMVDEAKLSKLKPGFNHFLAVWPWARYITSLCFSFFISKMRVKLSDYFRELLSGLNAFIC